MIRIAQATALCMSVFLAAPLAHAQMGRSSEGVSLKPKPEDTVGPARPAPPPALPGSRSQAAPAPATKPASEMSPNEALFDSINRGDIAAARDALSRGADLNAQNVLGMTPMELSVDLGRNDISFLLLSMRGGTSRTAKAATQPDLTQATARQGGKKPAAATARVTASPAQAVRTPVLFANNGGAPVQSAGFLGFDPDRTAR
jgi:hypothetical protein